jgi:hypothetical protein
MMDRMRPNGMRSILSLPGYEPVCNSYYTMYFLYRFSR